MTTRLSVARMALVGAAALVAIVLAACSGAGTTLPAGQAYLTITNPNTGTLNENYYNNILIDNKAQSPNQIIEGTQQRYVVTASKSIPVQFDYVQPSAPLETVNITVSVPPTGCTIIGPTPTTTYSSGC